MRFTKYSSIQSMYIDTDRYQLTDHQVWGYFHFCFIFPLSSYFTSLFSGFRPFLIPSPHMSPQVLIKGARSNTGKYIFDLIRLSQFRPSFTHYFSCHTDHVRLVLATSGSFAPFISIYEKSAPFYSLPIFLPCAKFHLQRWQDTWQPATYLNTTAPASRCNLQFLKPSPHPPVWDPVSRLPERIQDGESS